MCKTLTVFFAVVVALSSVSQDAEYSHIVCTGEATVGAPPDLIEFSLVSISKSATMYDAAAAISLTETGLGEQLAELSAPPAESNAAPAPGTVMSKPVSVLLSGISVSNAIDPVAQRSAQIQFSLDTLRPVEERTTYACALCDKMRTLALALKCEMKGPFLKVRNEKQHVQTAIYRAAENAYVSGEGAALALHTQVVGVVELKVDAVLWDFDREWRSAATDVENVSCKVKVTVTYSHGVTP